MAHPRETLLKYFWGSVAIAAVCVLSGCATTAGYESVLQSWVGDSTDHLVAVWGIPQQQWDSPGGGKIFQYQRSNEFIIPGATTSKPVATTYSNGTVSGTTSNGVITNASYNGTSTTYAQVTSAPTVIQQSCVTRFITQANGEITSWAWEGNNCVAIPPKAPIPVYSPPLATDATSAKMRCFAARSLCEEHDASCPDLRKQFDADGLACPGVNRKANSY
jgi:hypothetical protein